MTQISQTPPSNDFERAKKIAEEFAMFARDVSNGPRLLEDALEHIADIHWDRNLRRNDSGSPEVGRERGRNRY